MRITRKQAYQAHPTPSHAYYPPRDPLEPDITQQPQVVVEYEDSGEQEKVFKCKDCGDVVFESEVEMHECEEEEYE